MSGGQYCPPLFLDLSVCGSMWKNISCFVYLLILNLKTHCFFLKPNFGRIIKVDNFVTLIKTFPNNNLQNVKAGDSISYNQRIKEISVIVFGKNGPKQS